MQLESSSRLSLAPDLSQALQEARAIADGVGQSLSSAHLLFALFTVPNPAEVLLRERQVDEDVLLAQLPNHVREAPHLVRAVLDQAEQTALRCDARQTNTLHLLVGMLRCKDCVAYALLERVCGPIPVLRNHLMSLVTGVLPRRLLAPIQNARSNQKRAPQLPRATRPTAQQPEDDWVVPKKTFVDPEPTSEGASNGGAAAKPASRAASALPPVPPASPDHIGGAIEFADDDDDDDLPIAHSYVSDPPAPAPSVRKSAPASPPPASPPKRGFHITTHPTTAPTEYDLDPDRFPWLTSLGRNLSALAVLGQLDPVVGRQDEMTQIVDVLGKRRANNPCLVGEPGVGKTAVAEGLAVKLVNGDHDVAPLFGKVIVELDMGRIMAGTALRGSFSERMQGLKKDVERARGKVIVFIDEIHTVMGAGASGDSPQDAANELKAALARGVFPCIGSTTLDEYRKYIEADPAMERRFVKILIEEPNDESSFKILRGACPLYEQHHKVSVTDDGIFASVQLSSRFIHDRKLPGKALDLLDLAMSRARRAGEKVVRREEVARVCSEVAKVPLERILLDDASRFLEMERFLEKKVIGHQHTVGRVAETIRRNYAGFVSQRPMGSFLFLGPSGVGKTELAKGLADFLYGSADALVRLDMSEYSEAHTVARLVGAPPGYVGHAQGGQLTEAIRRRPHAVVLLDEIEKAHTDVLPLLLQLLDEGKLTDSKGRAVTFRHAVIVMTSNLGAAMKKKTRRVGFATDEREKNGAERIDEEACLESARGHFLPELWARIEDKLVFQPLTQDELKQIAGLLLTESSRHLSTTRNIAFFWDDEVLETLVQDGDLQAGSGARLLRRAVQRLVEAPLSEAILRKEVREGDRVNLRAENGHILATRRRSA